MTATTVAPAPVAPVAARELNAHDRCDSCGVQAYVEVEIAPTISRLLFCAHHSAEHEMKWAAEGYTVTIDERYKLKPKTQQGEVY